MPKKKGIEINKDNVPLIKVEFRNEEIAKLAQKVIESTLLSIQGVATITINNLSVLAFEDDHPSSTEDLLFVEDTQPATFDDLAVPSYSNKFSVLDSSSDNINNEDNNVSVTRSHVCFNCEENHLLKDCPYPKDYTKINQNRKDKFKVIRYHIDDQDKEEQFEPGKISKELRNALGLTKHQLPLHIYKMRHLGYPPGWLLHAKIIPSGIALFDSQGNTDNINQELVEQYDIKKIIEFPGFNVPLGPKCRDESKFLHMPPYSEEDSKEIMIERLKSRSSANQGYKRKKLNRVKPEVQPGDLPFQVDMDIDNDGNTDELSNSNMNLIPNNSFIYAQSTTFTMSYGPPLPPNLPPKLIEPPPLPPPDLLLESLELPPLPPPLDLPPLPPTPSENNKSSPKSTDSEDKNDDEYFSQCNSLSLEDLENKKKSLLEALNFKDESESIDNDESNASKLNSDNENNSCLENKVSSLNQSEDSDSLLDKSLNTPQKGKIIQSTPGTPMYSLSQYGSLPCSTSFSKDICDIISFENLPNSTGKYERMSGLIKKIQNKISNQNEES